MKKIGVIVTIMLITTIFFMFNKKQEVKLDNVKIKEEKNKNVTFAMYKETSNNTYEEVEGNAFPTEGYILNISKSKCIDESGNEINDILTYDVTNKKVVVDTNKTSYCYLYFAKEVVEFDYTGSEQTFTVPISGTYKLETWGAQGGKGDSTYVGGYGGYSVGNIELVKNQIIYINIGGYGGEPFDPDLNIGGYNGGGFHYTASGGGATHISLEMGLLSSLSNKLSSIIIVSGGGGSSSFHPSGYGGNTLGGHAGGYLGNAGSASTWSRRAGQGGTQSSGGAYGTCYDGSQCGYNGKFGSGGDYINCNTAHCNSGSQGGGGAGLYGGGSARHAGGGGGSGYVGNTNLTDKHMTCYNCTTSNDEHTKTISNTCVDANPVADCSKQGNGYAKITFIG